MSDAVIRAESLGKKYLIGHESQEERYVTLRDVLARSTRSIWRKTSDMAKGRAIVPGDITEEFWALKDINFEVKRGEVLGIIGRNGAGKSTLLKILSRITEPTEGRVTIEGRVASLLEVGTGFHPELTGRENIYLNGAILGMTRSEIKKRFDEIVSFAGVEKFLDTPVKRFSSGMYVRLAFAVAAHMEPDILIVDEVLAVGDLKFQKKSIGKMKGAATSEGRTTLFVSHNMGAIQSLCNRVVHMQSGRIVGIGDVDSQVDSYLRDCESAENTTGAVGRKLSPTITLDTFSFSPNPIVSGDQCNFHLEISSSTAAQVREIVILLYSAFGVRTAILDLRSNQIDYSVEPGKPFKLKGAIHSMPLVEGEYSAGLYIHCGDLHSDVYDLAPISVYSNQKDSDFPPYPAHNRGLIDLSYEFEKT